MGEHHRGDLRWGRPCTTKTVTQCSMPSASMLQLACISNPAYTCSTDQRETKRIRCSRYFSSLSPLSPVRVYISDRSKTLDVNGNMLTHLPPKFGSLRLRRLKLSYNRLETLSHDVFLPALKGTLKKLWLSNNNLLQLPDSFVEASLTPAHYTEQNSAHGDRDL